MILTRIKESVLIDANGCWLWLGTLDHRGYGRIKYRGRMARTHIVSFVAAKGATPAGTVLDHVCRTRHCCNPEHLEPVPGVVNTRRGRSLTNAKREQTHCVNGHELAGDNVYVRLDRPGCRECRACKRERAKRPKSLSQYLEAALPGWNDHTPDRGPQ